MELTGYRLKPRMFFLTSFSYTRDLYRRTSPKISGQISFLKEREREREKKKEEILHYTRTHASDRKI